MVLAAAARHAVREFQPRIPAWHSSGRHTNHADTHTQTLERTVRRLREVYQWPVRATSNVSDLPSSKETFCPVDGHLDDVENAISPFDLPPHTAHLPPRR